MLHGVYIIIDNQGFIAFILQHLFLDTLQQFPRTSHRSILFDLQHYLLMNNVWIRATGGLSGPNTRFPNTVLSFSAMTAAIWSSNASLWFSDRHTPTDSKGDNETFAVRRADHLPFFIVITDNLMDNGMINAFRLQYHPPAFILRPARPATCAISWKARS